MFDGKVFSDDWTRNWQGSIAVKITSVVMWALIIVVFALAMVFALPLSTLAPGSTATKGKYAALFRRAAAVRWC